MLFPLCLIGEWGGERHCGEGLRGNTYYRGEEPALPMVLFLFFFPQWVSEEGS